MTTYPSSQPLAVLILGHGAGAGQSSPFMVRVAQGMAARGVTTVTFDFPYMAARRKVPDRAPVLEHAWRTAIEETARDHPALPLLIGGKSMGGRIATQVAAQGADEVRGVVLLGYPLHPPGRPEQRRDAHLPSILPPMLFVQGSRDAFGTADDIAALLPSLQRATLHAVAGGDHSFKLPGKADAIEPLIEVVAGWIRKVVAR